jgi:FtsH ternary system domain X1
MTAVDSVLRVIAWAADPQGPLPVGDPLGAAALEQPHPDVDVALGRLVQRFAAQHHLGNPPCGCDQPLSLEAAMLALALSVAPVPGFARLLLRHGVRSVPAHLLDALSRHALVAPARKWLPAPLLEPCLVLSPLTALLYRPGDGQSVLPLEMALLLIEHPAGRCMLTRELAQPVADPEVLSWRAELMGRLLHHSPEAFAVVLDVYETAVVQHGERLYADVASAFELLDDLNRQQDTAAVNHVLALGQWWGQLAAIELADPESLRRRRYLGYDFRRGLELHRAVLKARRGQA